MTEIKGHGFLLRLIRAQDADVIVRILTTTGEKISAFAKAGLKSRKRFGGALEPLTQIDFRATKKGEQDLLILEETQVRHEFKGLRTDFERLTCSSYIAELTELGAREGLESPEIYNLLGASWRALESGLPISGVARQFEIKLLSILGWLPGVNSCARCGAAGKVMTLRAETGQVTCENCGISPIVLDLGTQNLVAKLLSTSVMSNDVTDSQAHSIQKMTGALFHSHFGAQKLKSLEFLGSLRRFQK